MVTRRIRTEYMKKFKDPKWETYSRCYEELLNYRLGRRMLEHSHKPWFWGGSDTSDSDTSPPHTRSKGNQVDPLRGNEDNGTMADTRQQEDDQCGGGGGGGGPDGTIMALVPKISLPEEEEDGDAGLHASAVNGGQSAAAGVHLEENSEQKSSSKPPDKPQTKALKPRKSCLRASRVRPASPLQKPREDSKENRHPFALYGSGEQQAEMAGRKTHNVCPAASTKEIHESALRAKTRREVERQIQSQRAERRKTKSADLPKNKTRLSQPEFNPWLTEYMRCFSSCSR